MQTVISLKSNEDRLLTSWEVGDLLQVNPSSVNKWVKEGRISAFRTPGGHRRIRVRDLVKFLSEHKMPIPSSLGSERRRLLIVDDDERYLRSLTRLFKSHEELDVRLVNNGIDALVLVGSFQPQAIVLDVFMPGVDGIEVCRRLREREETHAIDVIIATGSLTPEIERKAQEAGARACLSKPIDFAALLAAVEPNQVPAHP